jgi:hypothetical protein
LLLDEWALQAILVGYVEAPDVVLPVIGFPVRGKNASLIRWSPEVKYVEFFIIGGDDGPCIHFLIHNEVIPYWFFFASFNIR